MSQFRIKSWKLLLSFALAAVLVTVLTLSAVAQQDPEKIE